MLFKQRTKVNIFPVSGPGSAGMEMCFVNMVEPGDKVLVCINGVFGGRMLENVVRCGGQPIIIKDDWGKPVNLNKVEDALKNNQDIKVVAFVHAETSTGVLSDGEAISKLAKKYGAYTIMDTVTSLTGVPVMMMIGVSMHRILVAKNVFLVLQAFPQ